MGRLMGSERAVAPKKRTALFTQKKGSRRLSQKPSSSDARRKTTAVKYKKPKHLKRKLDKLQTQLFDGGSDKGIVKDEEITVLQTKLQDKIQKVAIQQREWSDRKTKGSRKQDEPGKRSETTIAALVRHPQDVSQSQEEDDHDSEISDSPLTRKRGRRRRGNKALLVDKISKEEVPQNIAHLETLDTPNNPSDPPVGMESNVPKQRRCIGRKPVTDFKVGSIYSGKIVYVKPALGVFIDINCHSDAFCHISELPPMEQGKRTNINKERPVGNVGDVIDQVRVISVNRKKKQITVTLRTDRVLPIDDSHQVTKVDTQTTLGKRKELSTTSPLFQLPPTPMGGKNDSTTNYDKTLESQQPSNLANDLKRQRKLDRRAQRRLGHSPSLDNL